MRRRLQDSVYRDKHGYHSFTTKDLALEGKADTARPVDGQPGLLEITLSAYGEPSYKTEGRYAYVPGGQVTRLGEVMALITEGDNPRIVAIAGLEVPRELRDRGVGERIVLAAAAAAGSDAQALRVDGINNRSIPFWKRIGVEIAPSPGAFFSRKHGAMALPGMRNVAGPVRPIVEQDPQPVVVGSSGSVYPASAIEAGEPEYAAPGMGM